MRVNYFSEDQKPIEIFWWFRLQAAVLLETATGVETLDACESACKVWYNVHKHNILRIPGIHGAKFQ